MPFPILHSENRAKRKEILEILLIIVSRVERQSPKIERDKKKLKKKHQKTDVPVVHIHTRYLEILENEEKKFKFQKTSNAKRKQFGSVWNYSLFSEK